MAALLALAGMAGCQSTSASPAHGSTDTGLVLLSLADGSVKGQQSVGSDPVAVTVSEDGRMAFVADSAPGDVYGVKLPALTVAWKQHVGGAPFALLAYRGHLLVSLYDGGAVVELDPATGAKLNSITVTPRPAAMATDSIGNVIVAGTSGLVEYLDGKTKPGGPGFGIASVGDQIWTADYERAELVQAGGHRVGLPLPVFAFWLSAGEGSTLLISAEGAREDSDPGAVLAMDTHTEQFTILARPRDPDQVIQSGSTIFVAAHGDHEVEAIAASKASVWAHGIAAVGLAADPSLNLLVVVTNSHE